MQVPVLLQNYVKLFGLGENRGPGLDYRNIFIHVLTSTKGLRELVDDLSEKFESTDVVSRLDLRYSLLHVCNDISVTLVARLNLGPIIVPGHTVHETGHELRV